MLHFNCENDDAAGFLALLDAIAERYADVLARMA